MREEKAASSFRAAVLSPLLRSTEVEKGQGGGGGGERVAPFVEGKAGTRRTRGGGGGGCRRLSLDGERWAWKGVENGAVNERVGARGRLQAYPLVERLEEPTGNRPRAMWREQSTLQHP